MLESQLVNDITSYLDKYKIRYSKEIHMGIGIPDVSINIGASKNLPKITDYYLLSLIEYISEKKHVSVNDLVDHFSYDKTKVQNYLNQLNSCGIAQEKNNQIVLNRKIFRLNLGKIISIEAKIKDWKSGILQAQRYLMFSDYSYLALPKDRINAANTDELIEAGIGLLAVSTSSMEEVIPPSHSTEWEYKQKYIITSTIIQKSPHLSNRRRDGVFSNLH